MLDIKNLKIAVELQSRDAEENDVLVDVRYICKSGSLIT